MPPGYGPAEIQIWRLRVPVAEWLLRWSYEPKVASSILAGDTRRVPYPFFLEHSVIIKIMILHRRHMIERQAETYQPSYTCSSDFGFLCSFHQDTSRRHTSGLAVAEAAVRHTARSSPGSPQHLLHGMQAPCSQQRLALPTSSLIQPMQQVLAAKSNSHAAGLYWG